MEQVENTKLSFQHRRKEASAFCVHERCLRGALQIMTMLEKSPFPKETGNGNWG